MSSETNIVSFEEQDSKFRQAERESCQHKARQLRELADKYSAFARDNYGDRELNKLNACAVIRWLVEDWV